MNRMHNLFPSMPILPLGWREAALLIAKAAGETPILCGGALRDFLHGKPVKDLDFFVPFSMDAYDRVRDLFLGREAVKVQEIGRSCEGLNEVMAVLGFAAHDSLPEINVIFLDPEVAFDMEAVASRCDFGICQIAATYHGLGLWDFEYTTAFAEDVASRTFTLTRTGDEERSLRRWDRLREKYPEHRLVAP